jgi:hypothetical protein
MILNLYLEGLMSEDLHRLGFKLKFAYSIVGLVLGLACIIAGVILGLGGVAGNTAWTASALGLSTSMTDATPGVIVFVVGIFFVLITRFSVRATYQPVQQQQPQQQQQTVAQPPAATVPPEKKARTIQEMMDEVPILTIGDDTSGEPASSGDSKVDPEKILKTSASGGGLLDIRYTLPRN